MRWSRANGSPSRARVTLDRLRLQGALTVDEAAARLRVVTEWLEAIYLVLLRPPVLSRASEPMPTPLGTLDAIHLATALVWRERAADSRETRRCLGLAARAFGFEVRVLADEDRG
jgi:hypothetical protein